MRTGSEDAAAVIDAGMMGVMTSDPAEEGEIELGAIGGDLRLWQAKEALRQAELRLAAQASALQAFETRATAILGWIALIISALAGAAVVNLDAGKPWRALGLSAGLIPAGVSALAASRMLWPKEWNVPGHEPATVRAPCTSELAQIEWLADGYAIGIAENAAFLKRAGRQVRVAWWCILAAPIIAGVAVATGWALAA